MMRLKSYAIKSHSGPFLSLNEDGSFYRPKGKIGLVIDGLGGQGVGDKLLPEISGHILDLYERWSDDPDLTLPFNFNHRYLIETNVLLNSISLSHKSLLEKNENIGLDKRCAASVLGIVEGDSVLNIVSVGNIRSYLLRRGGLIQTVREDSLELVTKDSNLRHFRCHPQSVIGMYSDYSYQVKEVKIIPGDKHFICTDGIYSRINDQEIFNIIKSDDKLPARILEECMGLANSRGNLDNQSALILNY